MTVKRRKFVDSYIISGNGTQSYIDAGYSVRKRKSAEANARKLLANEKIQKAMQEKTESIRKATIADQQEILEILTKILRGEDPKTKVSDKIRAAELIGKRYSMWTEKHKFTGEISISEMADKYKKYLIDD